MEKNMNLSDEEQATIEKYLSKYERNAKTFNKTRWLILLLKITCITLGSYYTYEYLSEITSDYTLVDKIKSFENSEITIREYWFVAELRRIACILENLLKLNRIATISGTMGTLLITFGIFLGIYLIYHWNDAEKNKMISKILRIKWDEFKASHKI